MTLHRPHRQKFTGLKTLIAVFSLVVCVLAADRLFGGQVSGIARETTAIAWNAVSSIGNSVRNLHMFSTRASLSRELEIAQARADKGGAYFAEYKLLRAELEALQGTRTQKVPHIVAARVLAPGRASPYGTVVIAAGSTNGVALGDIVLVSEQTAIGTVSELSTDTSLVLLFSAPGAVSDVLIGSGGSTTPAQLTGRGNGNFEAEVLRDAPLAVGDVAALRSGYAIALVGRSEMEPADPVKSVLLRVPVNLETLRFVDIVHADSKPVEPEPVVPVKQPEELLEADEVAKNTASATTTGSEVAE